MDTNAMVMNTFRAQFHCISNLDTENQYFLKKNILFSHNLNIEVSVNI